MKRFPVQMTLKLMTKKINPKTARAYLYRYATVSSSHTSRAEEGKTEDARIIAVRRGSVQYDNVDCLSESQLQQLLSRGFIKGQAPGNYISWL